MNTPCETSDLLIFSHLKWDQSSQRPHHLISRYAKYRRVFFIESPVTENDSKAHLRFRISNEGVTIISPSLPSGLEEDSKRDMMEALLRNLIANEEISHFTALYHTSEALSYSRNLCPFAILFDYFESHFEQLDEELINRAHLVFSRGEAKLKYKKSVWNNMFAYPYSVECEHFLTGRKSHVDPNDQMNIPYPRIGYYGKLDHNFNFNLLESMAKIRPEFQFVVLTENDINKSCLPKKDNIHFLGLKNYSELPSYLAGWDCFFLPYCADDSHHSLNVNQIPEALSSGIPIVSTSVYDSIHPYSGLNLIRIADHPEHFVQSIESAIDESMNNPEWLQKVDQYLLGASWEATFEFMQMLEVKVKKMMQNIRPPAYEDSSLSAIGIV